MFLPKLGYQFLIGLRRGDKIVEAKVERFNNAKNNSDNNNNNENN